MSQNTIQSTFIYHQDILPLNKVVLSLFLCVYGLKLVYYIQIGICPCFIFALIIGQIQEKVIFSFNYRYITMSGQI